MGTGLVHQANYRNRGTRLAEPGMRLLLADATSYWSGLLETPRTGLGPVPETTIAKQLWLWDWKGLFHTFMPLLTQLLPLFPLSLHLFLSKGSSSQLFQSFPGLYTYAFVSPFTLYKWPSYINVVCNSLMSPPSIDCKFFMAIVLEKYQNHTNVIARLFFWINTLTFIFSNMTDLVVKEKKIGTEHLKC